MGRKSISMRLEKAHSNDKRLEIALSWAKEWEASTLSNIKRLEMAVSAKDFDLQCIALARVKEDLLKRLDALPRVIIKLIDLEEPGPEANQNATPLEPQHQGHEQKQSGTTEKTKPSKSKKERIKCIMCQSYFEPKSVRSVRCPRCQAMYNKARRNELTKAKYQGDLVAPPLPDTHIYLADWAKDNGRSLTGALKKVSGAPHIYGAIKVRNPRGGPNVWAVSKGAEWH